MDQAQPVARDANGKMVAGGGSLNPGGRLRKISEIEKLVAHTFGPKVLTALAKLFEIGTSEECVTAYNKTGDAYEVAKHDTRSRVAALVAFIAHVKGTPKPQREIEDDEPLPEEVAGLMRKLFERPEVRRQALEVLQGGKT